MYNYETFSLTYEKKVLLLKSEASVYTAEAFLAALFA